MTEGFDRQHRRHYFWFLALLALASVLMLIAGFFEASPRGLPKVVRIALACVSLFATTASMFSLDRFRYTYPLVGFSSVAFAASSWAFGMPTELALFVAVSSFVAAVLSLIFKGALDLTDKPG